MGAIQDILKRVPAQPGIYFFKNAGGEIIYIGKAAVLKNRVRSYFKQNTLTSPKNKLLLDEIASLDWTVTDSEIDALFLESEMIKRYQPKYNIELKDDKHYLYVRINMKDEYPRVGLVRRPMDDGADYFGPYIAGIRQALKYLRRIFPYSTHRTLPKRVCLQHHLGLCPGVEEGKVSSREYKKTLRKLILYLRGRRDTVIKQLEKEMRRAAKRRHFEEAARKRDQVRSLRNLSKQIIFGDKERFDVGRDAALHGLQQLLRLNGLPKRIEAYDVSHIAGSHNVASMVVFHEGVPAKSEYRKFKMRTRGNDDFAHMREVITRRFSGRNLERWPKPDLLVIDGGKGQLAAALEVLGEKQIDIPTIGLAKRHEKIIRVSQDEKLAVARKFETIQLERGSHTLKLLMRIRDEAHRFAVTYHSQVRGKAQTNSELESVSGIGPVTRKKLIRHFGSLAGVKAASQSELVNVVGKSKTRAIKQYL